MICFSQDRTARAGGVAPAAPAGGAQVIGGRGCGYLLAVLLGATPALASEPFAVPSGQSVSLREVLLDQAPGELWVRFRFVAPAIARSSGSVDYDQAAPDMDHLCDALVLPYLETHAITPARVVISLMDRPVDFGTFDPAATQFFESYRPAGDRCIWEEF